MTSGTTSPKPTLTEGPIFPVLTRLAIPNIFANLLAILPFVVEAWRLAQIGTTALAGVALVFPLYMLLAMWSAGSVGGAVSGAVARAVGAGDTQRAEAIIRSAIVISIGGALFMALLVFGLGGWLFAVLGGEGQVLVAAWDYARILFTFSVIVWLFNMMGSVLRGAGDMVKPLVAIAVVVVVHVGLSGPAIGNYGIKGAAALILIGHTAGLLLLVFFLMRPTSAVRLRTGSIDWALTGQLLKPGIFAATQSFTTIVTSLVLTGFAARFGQNVLAGYGLAARVELLMVPLIFGVGGASIALGGAATGAGLRNRAIRVGWITAATAACVIGGIGILLALTVGLWAPTLSPNAETAAALTDYMIRVGPLYLFFAGGLALFFTCQGMGTLFYPVVGTFLRLAVILAGGYLIFASETPTPQSLFNVIAVGMVTYGAFIAIMLRIGPWRTDG